MRFLHRAERRTVLDSADFAWSPVSVVKLSSAGARTLTLRAPGSVLLQLVHARARGSRPPRQSAAPRWGHGFPALRRPPSAAGRRSRSGPTCADQESRSVSGKRMVKVLPTCGLLTTSMWPLCCSTIWRALTVQRLIRQFLRRCCHDKSDRNVRQFVGGDANPRVAHADTCPHI